MKEELDIEELAPWLVIVITLIGGGLRVFLLANKGMALDETFSIWLANHRAANMLQWIAKIDQNPPLYYLLLHYWIALKGDTPYYARLLSVLFGAGTIPIIYLTGKRMSGVAMGLAAAAILAFSPFNIRFAQEARMYSLLAFNAALAIYALVRLLTDPRSARPIGSQFREYLHAWHTQGSVETGTGGDFSYRNETRYQTRWGTWMSRHRWLPIQAMETDLAWVAFIVFSAATLLSHNTAVFLPLATNLFVLGLMLFQRKKQPGTLPGFQAPSFGNWVKAQVGIFLLWSPWIFALVNQASRIYREFWLPKPGWDTITQVLRSFLNESMFGRPDQAQLTWILYALVLCLGLLHYRNKLSQFILLAALFAVPFLGELIVSIRRPIFYDRSLIWTTIPLILLLAAGIVQLRFNFLIIVVVGILGAHELFSTSDYYRFMQKEDWNSAAGFVAYFAQKGDLVLFNTAWAQIPFDYYFKPYENQYLIQVKKQGVPEDMFETGIPETKMTGDDMPGLVSALNGRERVWLVYSHNQYTDPMGMIPQTLASKMTLVKQQDFYGGQVQLYVTP